MKAKEIAQWVIDNRYPKSENEKISDLEMYNYILDKLQQREEAERDAFKGGYLTCFEKAFGKKHDNKITLDELFQDYKSKKDI